MNRQEFWTLIEETHSESEGNPDGQALTIEERLATQEEKEILDFVGHLQDLLGESYTANLWAASFLINGNEDEDTYEAFRAWIIGQGKERYDLFLENPDAIVDTFKPEAVDEHFQLINPGLLYVGFAAWEEITGNDPEEMPLKMIEVELKGEFVPETWDEAYLEEEFPLLYEVLG